MAWPCRGGLRPYVFHVPVEGQLFNIYSESGEEQKVGREKEVGMEEIGRDEIGREEIGREEVGRELTERERKDYLDYLVQGKGER